MVLPKAARMRNSEEFRVAVRSGVRTGRPTLVVHAASAVGATDVQVGFVVSKAVGNAVTRNRVKRRLRHLSRDVLPTIPPGTRVVVRALPRAAMNPRELAGDLDKAWQRALHRLTAAELHPRGSRRARP